MTLGVKSNGFCGCPKELPDFEKSYLFYKGYKNMKPISLVPFWIYNIIIVVWRLLFRSSDAFIFEFIGITFQ